MPEAVSIGSIATQIAVKGFATLFGEILKHSVRTSSGKSEDLLAGKKTNDYFSSTFERRTKVKTLLNRDVPVDLLQKYVNVSFSTKDRDGNPVVCDDYDLIENLHAIKRFVIVGTAGGGKTVFMRYLWISLFTNPEGRIPIYLELRRLNDLTSVDLFAFVSHNCLDLSSDVASSQLKKVTSEGRVVFVLDGFDEISIEKRVAIERQIIELARRYPNASIVVSGRPDDKFDAWQDFRRYTVQPLSQKQIVELIERVDFDDMVRAKFIIAVKKDLYEKHQSFLSSPLLATMMLLTFRYYAEIPNKIHVFYDLAFDTLFSMHDALKEAFNRKKYTDFPIDVFKRRLSCFCLLSYVDQRFEFTESEATEYIVRSSKIDGVKFDATAFLRDLLESVCILQKDGLNLSFTHRSFQEYFSSRCLSTFAEDKISAIVPRLAKRSSDSVLIMLFDMSRDLIERAYVLPCLSEHHSLLKKYGRSPQKEQLLECLGYSIHFSSDNRKIMTGSVVLDNDRQYFRQVLQTFYPTYFKLSEKRMNELLAIDIGLYEKFPFLEICRRPDFGHFILDLKRGKFYGSLVTYSSGRPGIGRQKLPEDETQQLAEWFVKTGHFEYLNIYYAQLWRACLGIPRAHHKRRRDTDGILGIIGV